VENVEKRIKNSDFGVKIPKASILYQLGLLGTKEQL
jgi:hypothetical protein